MRIITSYACTLDVETAEEALWRFNLYRGVMHDWLRDQGISDPKEDSPSDTFIQLTRRDVSHDGAEIDGFLLKQPILESSHLLHTRFDLAYRGRSLALFLQFSVERRTSRIAPTSIQAGCPRALATILESGDWRSGQVRMRPHCRRVRGPEGGKQIRRDIADLSRTTPIVLLENSHDGEMGGPYDDAVWADFVNRLEDDLGGVAQLVELDERAADALIPPNDPPARRGGVAPGLSFTRQYRELGMCGSVVRIIWPLERNEFAPDQHPAWGPWENFYEVEDDDKYDYPIHYGGSGSVPDPWITLFRGHELMGVRTLIRDTIYEQAALQPVPELIEGVRRTYEQAERKRLADTGDWEQMAQSYERQAADERDRADNAEKRLDVVERELVTEKSKNRELRRAVNKQKGRSASPTATLAPEATVDAGTVLGALHEATQTCQSLVFGRDVWDSANRIESEPALAKKLIAVLQALNEGTRLATNDQLSTSLTDWVYQQCAIESSPDAKSQSFKDDQGNSQEFSMHLKLKEATAANKAMRIYFDHMPDEGKTLVGYIGPHL